MLKLSQHNFVLYCTSTIYISVNDSLYVIWCLHKYKWLPCSDINKVDFIPPKPYYTSTVSKGKNILYVNVKLKNHLPDDYQTHFVAPGPCVKAVLSVHHLLKTALNVAFNACASCTKAHWMQKVRAKSELHSFNKQLCYQCMEPHPGCNSCLW